MDMIVRLCFKSKQWWKSIQLINFFITGSRDLPATIVGKLPTFLLNYNGEWRSKTSLVLTFTHQYHRYFLIYPLNWRKIIYIPFLSQLLTTWRQEICKLLQHPTRHLFCVDMHTHIYLNYVIYICLLFYIETTIIEWRHPCLVQSWPFKFDLYCLPDSRTIFNNVMLKFLHRNKLLKCLDLFQFWGYDPTQMIVYLPVVCFGLWNKNVTISKQRFLSFENRRLECYTEKNLNVDLRVKTNIHQWPCRFLCKGQQKMSFVILNFQQPLFSDGQFLVDLCAILIEIDEE